MRPCPYVSPPYFNFPSSDSTINGSSYPVFGSTMFKALQFLANYLIEQAGSDEVAAIHSTLLWCPLEALRGRVTRRWDPSLFRSLLIDPY